MTMLHDHADPTVGAEEARALEPLLDAMVAKGLLQCLVDDDGVKLYAITEAGKDFFETMEKANPWPGMPLAWGHA